MRPHRYFLGLFHKSCCAKIRSLFNLSSVILTSTCLLAACATRTDEASSSCFLTFAAETDGKAVGINSTTFGGDEIAQSFVLTEQKEISQVQLKLQKVGMETGDFTGFKIALRIQETASGKPEGTVMSASDATVEVTTIRSTSNFYTFTFSPAMTLRANTTYWLRARGTYPASSTNFIQWIAHDGVGGYSDGSALYETSGGDWQSSLIGDLRDLLFKVGCN